MNAGGGYGDPLERDPQFVLGDVLDGYGSVVGAREDYAVVIAPDKLTIDVEMTKRLRNERRSVS